MKNWTVLVYLAGNNDLSADMIASLKGMQWAAMSEKVNLVALYDTINPVVPTTVYEFSPKNRTSNLSRCEIHDESTAVFEKSSASAATLTKFIEWGLKNYPAKNLALILSTHGDGFQGRSLLVGSDKRGAISLPQLRTALEKGLGRSGKKAKRKFDILGFDSCLMGMLEVAGEMRGVADVLVSSQGGIPTDGWLYGEMLGTMTATDGKREAREYAAEFVRRYVGAQMDFAAGGRSVEMSACDLTKTDALVDSLGELADRLRTALPPLDAGCRKNFGDDAAHSKGDDTILARVKRQLTKTILDCHWQAQTFMNDQAVDVRDFSQNLLAACMDFLDDLLAVSETEPKKGYAKAVFDRMLSVAEACQNVNVVGDEFVIENRSSGCEYQNARGVSMFFPWSFIGLNVSLERYKQLEFAKGKGRKWLSFLSRYLADTMREPQQLFAMTPNAGDAAVEMGNGIRIINFPPTRTINFPPTRGIEGWASEYNRNFGRMKNISLLWQRDDFAIVTDTKTNKSKKKAVKKKGKSE